MKNFKRTISLFLCVWLIYNPTHPNDDFDPSKIKYCELPCLEKEHKSSGCNCTIGENHTEILTDIVAFRTDILRRHNDWRDFIARGAELAKNWSEAANMLALNYDLELEYLARCFAGVFEKDHELEMCRTSKSFAHYGQNVGGGNVKLDLNGSIELVTKWYNEIDHIEGDETMKKEFVTVFPGTHPKPIEHFSQIIWADEMYVGCARVWYQTNPNAFYRFVLVCNYAGSPTGANIPGNPIYEVGTKCSKCPEGMKCNIETGGRFTALCGSIKPVPKTPPIFIPKAGFSTTPPPPPSPAPDPDPDPGPVPEPTATPHPVTNATEMPPDDVSSVAVFLSCKKKWILFFVLVLLSTIDV